MVARLTNLSNRGILLILGAFVLVPGLWSLLLELTSATRNDAEWLKGFMQNFSTEMLGAIVTFALLYLVVEQRDRQRQEHRKEVDLKARFIREMGSNNNADALKAVRELQAHEWLFDGSLKWANLVRANLQRANLQGANLQETFLVRADLQEADLSRANLQKADLQGANLQKAYLQGANLQETFLYRADLKEADLSGAIVTDEQLTEVHSLKYATMPDGSEYDGQFNLEGDSD